MVSSIAGAMEKTTATIVNTALGAGEAVGLGAEVGDLVDDGGDEADEDPGQHRSREDGDEEEGTGHVAVDPALDELRIAGAEDEVGDGDAREHGHHVAGYGPRDLAPPWRTGRGRWG